MPIGLAAPSTARESRSEVAAPLDTVDTVDTVDMVDMVDMVDTVLTATGPLPAAMGPEEFAVAAKVLGAGIAVPVHYEPDQPEKAPGHVEIADPEERFRARVLAAGEWLDLGEAS
ncbi:hypothetical protein ACOBQX_08480 [Actinokineospora sp. G85]|uniref:hypothetical protein n=1 Tax=Actinokineospora sp. G85 TaxID=3406626 RepID=UPI003C745EC2